MAVKQIGKRHQIALLFVAGIFAIGGLHMIIFAPKTEEYLHEYNRFREQEGKIEGIKLLRDRGKIPELENMTKTVEAHYNDAMTTLGLTMDPAFYMLPLASWKEFTPPPNTPQESVAALKAAAHKEQRQQKLQRQLELVIEELKKLMAFEPDPTARNAMATFVGEGGWALPRSLPNNLRGGQLLDVICDIKDQFEILEKIPATQEVLKQQQRTQFEQSLARLGINYLRFRDMNQLPKFGEYAPLIHKLAYAILIEENLDQGSTCAGEPVTRMDLLKWLEINIPFAPLLGEDGSEMTINEMYFIYEQLAFTNKLLQRAKEEGVLQIAAVYFEEPGYTMGVTLDRLPFPTAIPSPTPTPEPKPNPYSLPPVEVSGGDPTAKSVQEQGITASLPGGLDIGYCLPIRLQLRANNLNFWKFVYEVLRQNSMAELDSYSIQAVPTDNQGYDLWFDVRMLHIPYLFALGNHPKPPAAPAAPAPADGAAPPAQ